MTVIENISKVYQTPDLAGNELTIPLKTYNRFFAKKIEDSVGMDQAAWKVTRFVLGLIAYPTFGILAAVGILIKFNCVSDLKNHNKVVLNKINIVAFLFKTDGDFAPSSNTSSERGHPLIDYKVYTITQDNFNQFQVEATGTMNELQNNLRRIHIQKDGLVRNRVGSVTFKFRVNDAI